MAAAPGASSASQDPIELDEEAKSLKLEQIKAEARKAIAESRKATLTAQLPTSSAEPLEGTVDVGEGAGLAGQVVAYRLLGRAATEIAAAVKTAKGSRPADVMVVEDRALVGSDWTHAAVSKQLGVETATVAEVLKMFPDPAEEPKRKFGATAIPAAALVVPQLLGAAASVIGMFRSNYAITSRNAEIGTTPLLAAVAQALLELEEVGVTVDRFTLSTEEGILDRFSYLQEQRRILEWRATRVKTEELQPATQLIADLRAQETNAATELDKGLGAAQVPPSLNELKARVEALQASVVSEELAIASTRTRITLAEAAMERVDAFTAAATAGDVPPLLTAALRERLHQRTGSNGAAHSHVLYVGVEGSGAETITRTNRFGSNGEVGFVGGLNVAYLLLDVASNALVAAGTIPLLGKVKYDLGDDRAGPLSEMLRPRD